MKFIHKKTKAKFETDNENLFSMLEREGYEKVEDKKSTKEENNKEE